MACVISVTFSVLVNGSPQGHFAAERGLRQGCPLSPYLFILCSDILSQITFEAERNSLYKGLKINRWAPSISHLLFANDSLLFGPATIENAIGVKNILQQYEQLSGQMVNFDKSSVYTSPHLDPVTKQILMDILGVVEMVVSDKYLGRHLLLPSSRISSFNSLLERCKRKLATWKSHPLSHAGRIVLLKSSIASIPIYTMGTTLLPKGVTVKLTQLQRNFWWGGSHDTRKLPLIGWHKIATPKNCGGLGFRDPDLVNISLVSKLVWRFLVDEDSIWCQLLRAKYLRNKAFWHLKKPTNVSHTWSSMLDCRKSLNAGCCWFVGRNSRIHIWNDLWVPSVPGFIVEGKENAHLRVTWVNELLLADSTQWNMPLLFQCFESFVAQAISRIIINPDNEMDKLLWLPMSSGTFTAKSMYKQLTVQQPSSSNSSTASVFPWSKLWCLNGISPRIILFLWRVMHGGIAVGSVLGRINHSLVMCKSCTTTIETIEHTLLHCLHAKSIWEICAVRLPPDSDYLSIQELFTRLLENGDLDQVRLAAAVVWMIWKARNDRNFNNKTTSSEGVYRQAQRIYNNYKNPPTMQSSFETSLEPTTSTTAHPTHWLPPPLNFIKINVDGACLEGNSAAGAIARDHNGAFIGCASKVLEPGTPIEAEAKAFILGLQLIRDLNLNNIIVEGDAKTVVDCINNSDITTIWSITAVVPAAISYSRDLISQSLSHLESLIW